MLTNHDNQEEKYTSDQLDEFFSKRKEERDEELKSRGKISDGNHKEASEILDKHLKDDVIIYSSDQLIEIDSTNGRQIVTYPGETDSGTKFIEKTQDLEETVTEVIAGNLYKALLYDRSPVFRLIEKSNQKSCQLGLKSKLLENFVTLNKFMENKKREKFLYGSQELGREVEGLEKIIAAMLLLGYGDLHGDNIGIMDIEHEDGSETTKKVYAKVDMSASFFNLSYTHYLQYVGYFEHILLDSIAHILFDPIVKVSKVRWRITINYQELKNEINTACNLFIKEPEYVKSLIHRALFYKKPLLRTDEELNLINDLAEKIIMQAKLLKEFANSEEFAHLKEYIASEYNGYINWLASIDKKIHGKNPRDYAVENALPTGSDAVFAVVWDEPMHIESSGIKKVVEANLNYNPLNNPKVEAFQQQGAQLS